MWVKVTKSQCMLEYYAEDNFYARFDTAITAAGKFTITCIFMSVTGA